MYLVDGNNVIGQRVGWHLDKEGARRRLLVELAELARVRRLRISVIFDGRPDQSFPDGSSYRGVKVYYARPGSDADSRLVELVESARERKNLTVVTSDRQLTARVRVNGVRVIRSGEFRRWVDEARDSAESAAQPGSGSATELKNPDNDEIGGWLRYFGVDPQDD
ncbi:MAG: hypothetical protein EBZ36_02010 [Acidobacteria bacterium]|nr:hypothetical protein [Acidobacteriota bacterium]